MLWTSAKPWVAMSSETNTAWTESNNDEVGSLAHVLGGGVADRGGNVGAKGLVQRWNRGLVRDPARAVAGFDDDELVITARYQLVATVKGVVEQLIQCLKIAPRVSCTHS
ncbi:hypothetical protein PG996_010581 [Apiospora saccharicola]|uniref:Uncharacterized protein n=1 Tax=Apiospora saccharicola TaxID=335842 RepID=A0ABR1URF0_9PEZI